MKKIERPYTIAQVAALTGFSVRTITRWFERERGVIVIERAEKLHKRRYRSIRIPRHVYERVIRRNLGTVATCDIDRLTSLNHTPGHSE